MAIDRSVGRRRALQGLAAPFVLAARSARGAGARPAPFRIATFSANVTPPLGHPLMGGGIAPAREVVDPLRARGFVLLGGEKPIVLTVIDWCEIRNDAYARWREVLANAAGTEVARVLVSCVHQHDAPIADLEAQRILDREKPDARIVDPVFHEAAVQRVGAALRESLRSARAITHFGIGQAKVDRVASNRRYLGPDGRPRFDRMSATRDASIRDRPEETIDPFLKTLSFWNESEPMLALSVYATHPMSYYGNGGVSADFVGMARGQREKDLPGVFHMYASGCSGNVTAGKYNDGSPENRAVLASRMHRAMRDAWDATKRAPIGEVGFRSVALRLEPRDTAGFTTDDLSRRLKDGPRPFDRCLAALGLSWRKRADAGATIDLPVVDFGTAQLVLLPGESYVEFQLLAQRLRRDSFVLTLGYGECAPGYVPIERAFDEDDTNLHDWCWVARGAETAMNSALREALNAGR